MITNRKISTASKLLKAKIFRTRSPLAVSWAVTYICNYSCHYCQRWDQKRNLLSAEEGKGIIDKLHRLGLARINFTGGEPLIRQEIGEWIDHAKQKSIKVAINSNGHFVPQLINRIKNCDLLNLSLEGPECLYKGSFCEKRQSQDLTFC